MTAYLRAANVKDGELDLDDVKEMNFSPKEQKAFSLRCGDILITEGSGSLKSVGASAIWKGQARDSVCFQNTLLRLRPRPEVCNGRYLAWWARHAFGSGIFASIASGANIYHISAERVRGLPIDLPSLDEQQDIANFLDHETAKIDNLVHEKTRLISLMNERIDCEVLNIIRRSRLVDYSNGSRTLPIRRALRKVARPAVPNVGVVTAFRDGQVTERSLRRARGYTLSASQEPQGQYVENGDVVIHGLDGFAGSIGTAEANGNCSSVYNVCLPTHGGDAHFLSRMLRILALQGYLGGFATSTRERAVDFRNWDLFGRIPIPSVGAKEQADIGARIRGLRPLRAAISDSQILALERRRSLITATITGQLDVSTANGRNVTD